MGENKIQHCDECDHFSSFKGIDFRQWSCDKKALIIGLHSTTGEGTFKDKPSIPKWCPLPND